ADAAVRRASLDSLRLLKETDAVPRAVEALADPDTQLAALQYLGELGGARQAKAVFDLAKRTPSAEVLPVVARLLSKWAAEEKDSDLRLNLAELQGSSGLLVAWSVREPLDADKAIPLVKSFAEPVRGASEPLPSGPEWNVVFATGAEARVSLETSTTFADSKVWLAHTALFAGESTQVQFLASSNSTLSVWLNGRRIHQRKDVRPYQPDSDRFDATLDKGLNVLLVEVVRSRVNTQFHLGFRRKTSTAEHERLTQAALTRAGNGDRGRTLFFNVAKSQ